MSDFNLQNALYLVSKGTFWWAPEGKTEVHT